LRKSTTKRILIQIVTPESGTFRTVEKVAVAFGACQLVLVPVMFMVKPSGGDFVRGLGTFHFGDNVLIKGQVSHFAVKSAS
jgi:hypothetical protein